MSSGILTRRAGETLIITINRPERANAVDAAASFAVDAAVREAETDASIGAIILTGAGLRAFCSGMDMKEAAEKGPGLGLIPGRGFCGITERFVEKPLIAAVNGAAFAGGFELALACDAIIASEAAEFALPEVKRGMAAYTGGVQRLARQLPRAAAMEIILTGAPVSARRLYQLGLVTRLAPPGRELDEALNFAEQCLASSRAALGFARRLFNHALDHDFAASIAYGHALGQEMFAHGDSTEGVKAYVEKRGAEFGR